VDSLKPGDLARIKSTSPILAEGPILVIRELKDGAALCVWFPRPNDPREATYAIVDLEKV
jgi:uncharacterized protein YodC (DUF2158 family)